MDEITMKALKNLHRDKKKELMDLQREIINLESDFLFERDNEKRSAAHQKLEVLKRKRWELIHQYR